MTTRRQELTGQRFGRLVVLRFAFTRGLGRKTIAFWWVRCDCGREKTVAGTSLRSGGTRSCGWPAHAHPRHGENRRRQRSHEYTVWWNAKSRCSYPSHNAWKNYGGRGIEMCARWRDSYEAFLADMGRCPPGMTIERI